MLNAIHTTGESFMLIKKSKGLKMDPCGTPVVTGS